MLDKANLVALMKQTIQANPSAPVNYSVNGVNLSYEDLNKALANELNELVGTPQLYRENKNLYFSVIEQTITETLPKKVVEQYSDFAEVKTFAQGDKPIFKRKLTSNKRAKQFITRVGLAGRYEVFKLGDNQESFEVRTSAIGGGVQVGFEEFLDGRVDMNEVYQVLMEGMDELIYKEIGAALKASVNQLPPANKVISPGFDEKAFDQLLTIASAYGPPTIYCTHEFAVNMIPKEAWRYTEDMKSELWRNGRLQGYKQWKVVILEQGFEDETNSRKVIDPGYAWIIPQGADSKPVKVAFEGDTLVKDHDNDDWSTDIMVYKKVGVTCMLANNICCYVDTALAGQMTTWNLDGVVGKVKNYAGQMSI